MPGGDQPDLGAEPGAGSRRLSRVARRGAGCDTDAADDRADRGHHAIADDTVRPASRYTYAVVAVDKAGNRSAESNRVEETARQ